MDDRLALVAAAVASPEDDTPRLVLADWLDEHGDAHDRARAEHIRVQVEADHLPNDSAAVPKAFRRAVKIQKEHGPAWLGPLLKLGRVDLDDELLFDRGLLFWWHVPVRTFLSAAHQ